MRKATVITLLMLSFLALPGQEATPTWLDNDLRSLRYPGESYFTGFSEYITEAGKAAQECSEQVKLQAQANLVSQIRLQLTTNLQSQVSVQSTNGQYDEREDFLNQTSVTSNAEIIGMKTETHYDRKRNTVYAFAYVNKSELIGYYKSNLSVNLVQAEGFVKTAQDLEVSGEKATARRQLELVKPILVKVFHAQELLTAIDVNTTAEDLQQAKTEKLHNTLTLMQVKLAQGVFVLVESNEDLFGVKTNIVAGKVKAELAKNGCSFVETVEQADFKLTIKVSTRQSSNSDNFVFCYADTQVELYDVHKQKIVYSDEIAQKGGANTQDKAGRKAMADVAVKVVGKLQPWIQ